MFDFSSIFDGQIIKNTHGTSHVSLIFQGYVLILDDRKRWPILISGWFHAFLRGKSARIPTFSGLDPNFFQITFPEFWVPNPSLRPKAKKRTGGAGKPPPPPPKAHHTGMDTGYIDDLVIDGLQSAMNWERSTMVQATKEGSGMIWANCVFFLPAKLQKMKVWKSEASCK